MYTYVSGDPGVQFFSEGMNNVFGLEGVLCIS